MKSEKKIVGKVQSIDVFNKRIDNLIAMRGTGGYDEYSVEDDGFRASLVTNGTMVYAEFAFSHYEAKTYNYAFPEKFRPIIEEIEIYRDGDSHAIVHTGLGDGDPPFVEAYIIPAISDAGILVPTVVRCQYPIKEISIAELEDARVGYDGTVHPTVGTAIRNQISALTGGSGIKAASARLTEVTVLSSAWEGADGLYSQVVEVADVTEYSKVDLLPSVEQLAIFHNKDVAFVTENEDGVVTVFAIGDKPLLDYTIQAQITEVEV